MNEIKHVGVLGMRWGRRRGVGTTTASDGVKLRGPNGKLLKVTSEYRDKKTGNLVVGYKKTDPKIVKEKINKIKKKVDSHPVMVVPVTVFKSEAALQKAIKMQKVKNVLAGVVGAMAIAGLVASTFDH